MSTTPAHRIGIEVDGATARLVEVDGDRVLTHRSERGPDAAAAVRALLPRSRRFADGEVVLVWTQGLDVRRLSLRPAPAAAWRAAMVEAAEDELFVADDDLALAGLVEETTNGTLEALVAATRASDLAALWDLASELNIAITVPPFCLTADGTYLAIRDASADITVVDGGRTVASRSLDLGALGVLLGALHLEPEAARGRLTRVVTGTAQIDPEAIAVVDAHVERLAGLVAEQVRAWRQQSVRTGGRAFVVGPGATIPSLPFRLENAGLSASSPPLPAGLDVSAIPEWDRFAYFGALLAATTPVASGSITTLANRQVDAARLRAADAAVRRRRWGVGAAVAAGAAAVLIVPLTFASLREAAAEHHQDAALERFSKVAETDAHVAHAAAGKAVYARHASADVRWAELHRQVTAALPGAASVEAVRFTRQGNVLSIDVSAAFPGDPYTAVSAWAERMRALNRPPEGGPANAVTIRSFAYDRDARTVRASLLVLVPVRPPFVEPRALPGPAQPREGRS
jgi:hypothetical protein